MPNLDKIASDAALAVLLHLDKHPYVNEMANAGTMVRGLEAIRQLGAVIRPILAAALQPQEQTDAP